jgi:subtilisin family serine protease
MRRPLMPAVFAMLALVAAAPAAAEDFVPGELIVRFKASARASERSETLAHRRAAVHAQLPLRGTQLVRLQPGDSVGAAAAAFERDPDVLYAEPNFLYRVERTPNDPMFGSLWGLAEIAAPSAWDTTTGSASVVVAVVDTGIAAAHPDLSGNLWANPGELADGDDDDGNGIVDDVNGYDAYENDGTPEEAATGEAVGHGTHVAGTIGAQGDNGTGVTGVNWDVSLMAVRAADGNGGFSLFDIVDAFDYACSEGAKVINGSFGGEGSSTTLRNAIAACPGALFVFAAGNGGDDDTGDDNDVTPHDPCTAPSANVLCVAAAGNSGLASFSNYGLMTVDLAAPGVAIRSTYPGGYADSDGTSMASPHVAGAAALVLSHRPTLTPVELKNVLMNAATPLPGLSGKVWTGGMLNVHSGLTASTAAPPVPVQPPPPPPPAPPPAPADTTAPTDPAVASTSHVTGLSSIDATVDVTWSGAHDFGSGVDGYSFAWDSSGTTVPDATKDAEETTLQLTSAPLAPGTYWFHIRTRDNAGNWSAGTHAGPFVIAKAALPQPKRCRVPRLKGKTLTAARTTLRRAGCKLGPVKRARSRAPKGRIVAQRPAAGRSVGKGTPVVVTISRGRR